jgi:hypothetical protein
MERVAHLPRPSRTALLVIVLLLIGSPGASRDAPPMLIPECDPGQCRVRVIDGTWPTSTPTDQLPLHLQNFQLQLPESEIARLLLLPGQIIRVEFAGNRVLEFHVVDHRDDLWREVLSQLQDGSLGTFIENFYTLNASELSKLEGTQYQMGMLSICNRCAVLGNDTEVRHFRREDIRLWVIDLQGDPLWERQFAFLSSNREGIFIQGFSSGFEFDDLMRILSDIE